MSLEKDIQQRGFRNDYQKLMLNLFYTHNFVVNKMTEIFKEYDITRQQYNVLRILRGQHPKPASINLIKERMLDKMSDASRIVERLRLKRLIERRNCEGDKRTVDVTISEDGLKLLALMDEPVAKAEAMFHHLTEEEAATLNALMDKIRSSSKE